MKPIVRFTLVISLFGWLLFTTGCSPPPVFMPEHLSGRPMVDLATLVIEGYKLDIDIDGVKLPCPSEWLGCPNVYLEPGEHTITCRLEETPGFVYLVDSKFVGHTQNFGEIRENTYKRVPSQPARTVERKFICEAGQKYNVWDFIHDR